MNMKKIMASAAAGALAVSALAASAMAAEYPITQSSGPSYTAPVSYASGDIELKDAGVADSGDLEVKIDTSAKDSWSYKTVDTFKITVTYFVKDGDNHKLASNTWEVKADNSGDYWSNGWGGVTYTLSYSNDLSPSKDISNFATDKPIAVTVSAVLHTTNKKDFVASGNKAKDNTPLSWAPITVTVGGKKLADSNLTLKKDTAVTTIAASESVRQTIYFPGEFLPNSVLKTFGSTAYIEVTLEEEPYSEDPSVTYVEYELSLGAKNPYDVVDNFAVFDGKTAIIPIPADFVYMDDQGHPVYGGKVEIKGIGGNTNKNEDGDSNKIVSVVVKTAESAVANNNDTTELTLTSNGVSATATVGTITGNGGKELVVNGSVTATSVSYELKLLDAAGKYVQPAGEVTLKLNIPEKVTKVTSDKVKHTCNDGTVEELTIENYSTCMTDGYVLVKTSKFSTFEFEVETEEDQVQTEATTAAPAPAETEAPTANNGNANPGTGVALAVIPAIVAAAGVVISKKRG